MLLQLLLGDIPLEGMAGDIQEPAQPIAAPKGIVGVPYTAADRAGHLPNRTALQKLKPDAWFIR
jgi:hypothetical protein